MKYQWYFKGNPIGKDSAGIYFKSLAITDSGDYKVDVSNTCGVTHSATAKVRITLNDDPKVTLAVDHSVVCTDSAIVLTATPTGGGTNLKYTFYDGTTAISPSDQTSATFTTPGLSSAGHFKVIMSFTTPCPAPGVSSPGTTTSNQKDVSVDQYVQATLTATSKAICDTALLLPGGIQPAVSGASGTWTIDSGSPNTATISDPSDSVSTLSAIPILGKVVLIWTVKNGICPSDTAKFTVTQLGPLVTPKVVLTANHSTVCEDSVIQLAATPSGGATDLNYTFYNGTTAISPNNQADSTFTTPGLSSNGHFKVIMSFTTPCPAPGVTSPGTVTSDEKDVSVDPYVQATLTTKSKTTCATGIQLPGGIQPAIPGSAGTWTIDPTSPNSATISDPSDSTSNLSDIPSLGKVVLIWTVKNGACPSDTAKFTVNQVGQSTTPKVTISGGVYAGDDVTNGKADTLCLATSYVLTNNHFKPLTEAGDWEVGSTDLTGITVSGTGTQNITPTGVGTTVVYWIISSSVPGCDPDTAKVTLKVNAAPTVNSIASTATGLCEDDALNSAKEQVQFSSMLHNPTFDWIISSVGTATATFSKQDSIAEFTQFSSTSSTGATDSIEVKATVTNACGSDFKTKTIVFQLKPRDFAPGDSILIPYAFCESNTEVLHYFGKKQPNADSIRWYWDGTLQGTTVNDPGNAKDTMHFERDATWGQLSQVIYPIIRAQLGNACGYGVSKTAQDTVYKAEKFMLAATSDKPFNDFCIPTDLVGVWAEQVAPDSTVYGSVAQYQFSSSSGILQAFSDSRVFYSSFQGDTVITVTAHPLPTACLTQYHDTSVYVNLTGFDKPTNTIVIVDTTACEGTPIALKVSVYTRNSGTTYWYKKATGGDLLLNHSDSILTLSQLSDSGSYYAVVENALKQIDPTSHCPNDTSKTVGIKFFQYPNPTFSPNPMLIYYDANSPGVAMPLVSTGTLDSVFDIQYSPTDWLVASNDSLFPIIKTTKEEIERDYTLTLKSGIKGGTECVGSGTVRIINTLPLNIPNAFSPNGDGKNDTWVIEGLGKYPNTSVKVFNRWGNAIFTDSYGYRVPWDGSDHGTLLPTGTYYYIIDLLGSPDGKNEMRTGSLTIVR